MANSFINKKVDLTTTDLTTLYTVPSFKSAVVKSLIVSEDAGSGSTITITLVNASGAIFNLFKDKAIASKATTELLTQPLVMEESEVLKTGEKYKNDEEWKAKGIPPEDIRRDVRVIMPSLDLFGETK
jgi:hypothetical protein